MSGIYRELRGGGRLSFGAEEFIFVELSEDMRIPQALAIQALSRNLIGLNVPGIVDVCPAHASYMIRFDPDTLDLDRFLKVLEQQHYAAITEGSATIDTEIIEIPVLYGDPWTNETALKFRDRHQDPTRSDFEYMAHINGFGSTSEFAEAHSANPFLATFPNFVPGNAESVQLVPRELQIQAPKYLRPRTETPSRAVGHGGAFTNIYPSFGTGGVQIFGRTPINIVDMSQQHPDFEKRPVLLTAGSIISFRPIDQDEYFTIRTSVERGEYRIRREDVTFSVDRHLEDWQTYNRELTGVFK